MRHPVHIIKSQIFKPVFPNNNMRKETKMSEFKMLNMMKTFKNQNNENHEKHLNIPGSAGGPGSRDQTLAVKRRKNA